MSTARQDATLRQVASLAGVSTATVVRVLRGTGYFSERSRIKVEQAVAATGYRVNAVARALSSQRTMTIGYMLHEVAQSAFFTGVALGAAEEAAHRGYGISLFNSQADPAREARGVAEMLERRVDGIIFGTSASKANVDMALDAGVAVVEVERPRSTRSGAILMRNREATACATRHLIDLGHRELGFVGSAPMDVEAGVRDAAVERDRLAGFMDTATERRSSSFMNRTSCWAATSILPTRRRRPGRTSWSDCSSSPHRPTAVLIISDVLAAGALRALRDAGLTVPERHVDRHRGRLHRPVLAARPDGDATAGRRARFGAVRMIDAMVDAGLEAIEIPHEVHLEMTFIERESTAKYH